MLPLHGGQPPPASVSGHGSTLRSRARHYSGLSPAAFSTESFHCLEDSQRRRERPSIVIARESFDHSCPVLSGAHQLPGSPFPTCASLVGGGPSPPDQVPRSAFGFFGFFRDHRSPHLCWSERTLRSQSVWVVRQDVQSFFDRFEFSFLGSPIRRPRYEEVWPPLTLLTCSKFFSREAASAASGPTAASFFFRIIAVTFLALF